MPENRVYHRIRKYFPLEHDADPLLEYLSRCHKLIDSKMQTPDAARLSGPTGESQFRELVEKYSSVSETGDEPDNVLGNIVKDLFSGIPRWRSPKLQYNVGTSANSVAVAAYALALEENIYAINNGLAGNTLVAEEAVVKILADLGGVKTIARGFFTFGGTSTNLYAKKLGLKKAFPGSTEKGIQGGVKVMITRDAHFSHDVSIDWLGIGKENTVIVEPGLDRRSSLEDAKRKMAEILNSGGRLASIAINGGTTYNHIVDDIRGFVDLRNRFAKEYSLNYLPHLHVDSVIGWSWLAFKGYDFDSNPLEIDYKALDMIREQYERISYVHLADSWAADFHKGVGSCPVDCSIFIANDEKDFGYISKEGKIDAHQLAREFSFSSPVDFTLETSRSAGPALAALVSLETLGLNGYRRNLANLIEQTVLMRSLFHERCDIHVCHEESSLGFVTMLRLIPPEFAGDAKANLELSNPSAETVNLSLEVNKYMKEFFKWDESNRMKAGQGVDYSFSSGYISLSNGVKISGAKLYPVSPHFNEHYARNAVETILSQKDHFDDRVWRK